MRGPHHSGGPGGPKRRPIHGHFYRPFFRPMWTPFGGLGCLFGLIPFLLLGLFVLRPILGHF